MNRILSVLIAIRNLMGAAPSTDRAIAGITKAVDQLNAVVASENAVIEAQRKRREEARQKIVDAAARADRAERIAIRFSALIQE